MRIEIKGKQIHLNPADVKIAKQMIGNFITQINDISLRHNTPGLYITMLAVMNLMSQSSLEMLDEKKLEIAMNSINQSKKGD